MWWTKSVFIGNDENIFNIRQGVSINIFIRKSIKSKRKVDIKYFDLFGKKKDKFDYLIKNNLKDIEWIDIKNNEPLNLFIPFNYSNQKAKEVLDIITDEQFDDIKQSFETGGIAKS